MFNETFQKRFWKKVNKTPHCWIWSASITSRGYGQIGKDSHGNMIKAHRASYILHKGEIPEGILVCHHCDNPKCVNPDHLFLGTAKDNHMDRNRKNRQAKGERMGNSVLKENQVIQIRKEFSTNQISMKELSVKYNVYLGTIWQIVRNKTWKHLIKENI